MELPRNIERMLNEPSLDVIWETRIELLSAGLPRNCRTWDILDRFYSFIAELRSRVTARQFSELLGLMDAQSIWPGMKQSFSESGSDVEFAAQLFEDLMSEGLMSLGQISQARNWEVEMIPSFLSAGWKLYEEVWRLLETAKPEQDPSLRRAILDQLLSPIWNHEASGVLRAALIGRLFQITFAWTVYRDFHLCRGTRTNLQ